MLPYQWSNYQTYSIEVQYQSAKGDLLQSHFTSFSMDWKFLAMGVVSKTCLPLTFLGLIENGAKQRIPLHFDPVCAERIENDG